MKLLDEENWVRLSRMEGGVNVYRGAVENMGWRGNGLKGMLRESSNWARTSLQGATGWVVLGKKNRIVDG